MTQNCHRKPFTHVEISLLSRDVYNVVLREAGCCQILYTHRFTKIDLSKCLGIRRCLFSGTLLIVWTLPGAMLRIIWLFQPEIEPKI